MRTLTNQVVRFVAMVVLAFAVPAFGSWQPGDPFKMHYPQLPDPNGWDVNMLQPNILADDWMCTQTGPVSDIHFWFSVERDDPQTLQALMNGGIVRVSIHDNIPPDGAGYSMPGNLLWSREFIVGLNATIHPWGLGTQGWYDPVQGVIRPDDHQQIWQMNITNITDPFIQRYGAIYWLDLSISIPVGALPSGIGWKTSLNHFEDDAVFTVPDLLPWMELRDPMTGQSLDLAFVITPEPSSALAGLIAGSALLLIRRRM